MCFLKEVAIENRLMESKTMNERRDEKVNGWVNGGKAKRPVRRLLPHLGRGAGILA